MADTETSYYVLDSGNPNRMLLYPPPNPSFHDRWMIGRRFKKPPELPVVAKIQPNYEKAELVPYFDAARLMSVAFYEALCEAGVDNLDVYDAVIRSEDGSITHEGYKAFNIVGVVQAADLKKTIFNDPPATRLIDASFESLAIDPEKASGLLMFRLAESLKTVIIHERVKRVIESKNFPHVVIREPSETIG